MGHTSHLPTIDDLAAELGTLRRELEGLRRAVEDAAQGMGEIVLTRRVMVLNAAHVPVATVEADRDGNGVLILKTADGSPRLLLHAQGTSGVIAVFDQAGPAVARLEGGAGFGSLELAGPGESRVRFGPDPSEALADLPAIPKHRGSDPEADLGRLGT